MSKPAIAVVGAGLMGHGIAYLFAAAGHAVRVQDPNPAAREALPQRSRGISDLLGTDGAEISIRIGAEAGRRRQDFQIGIMLNRKIEGGDVRNP